MGYTVMTTGMLLGRKEWNLFGQTPLPWIGPVALFERECEPCKRESVRAFERQFNLKNSVAVGNDLAGAPPHRSVQAELPHTALTSGSGVEAA